MTIISSSTVSPSYTERPAANPAVSPTPAAPDPVSPSSIVALGTVPDPDSSTYTPAAGSAASKTVWQGDNTDAVSGLMGHNFLYAPPGARFKGLGLSLLQRLGSNGGDFSQKISRATSVSQDATGLSTSSGTLHVKTASGTEVTLNLSNQDDSLEVSIRSDGTLSDSERAAIANLAQGFQQALDGMDAVPPQLKLDGLLNYDSQQLSAVDFQMDLKPAGAGLSQYVLHADKEVRSLNVETPSGKLQLKVDTRNPLVWGDAQQQATSMANYLKQFDQAATRGQADEDLMGLFKNAFSQLNHNTQTSSGARALSSFLDQDHAMLTGLADFDASITATPTQPNQKRHDEWKTFTYQTSQHTEIDDKDVSARHVVQQLQSHLSASFHTAPLGKKLDFGTQSYVYNQVDDSAQSRTEFAYHNSQLSQALVQQSARQLTHQIEYERGQRIGSSATPTQSERVVDLLPLLLPDTHEDGKKTDSEREAERAQRLQQAHALIQLTSTPADLRAAAQNGKGKASEDAGQALVTGTADR